MAFLKSIPSLVLHLTLISLLFCNFNWIQFTNANIISCLGGWSSPHPGLMGGGTHSESVSTSLFKHPRAFLLINLRLTIQYHAFSNSEECTTIGENGGVIFQGCSWCKRTDGRPPSKWFDLSQWSFVSVNSTTLSSDLSFVTLFLLFGADFPV